jgi:hypothetical protein
MRDIAAPERQRKHFDITAKRPRNRAAALPGRLPGASFTKPDTGGGDDEPSS